MTAPKVALRKITELTPDPKNARTHSDEQIEQLVGSINRFGWTNPILTDDLVRAGHGRLLAAKRIYESGERIYLAPGKNRGGKIIPAGTVPFIDCTGWSDEEQRAYALADNQLALQAGWDTSILMEQLDELAAADFDLASIGFDQTALDELAKNMTKPELKNDPEYVPEPQDNPISKLGDLWILGSHRIICGDSTDPETVAKLLGDEKPYLMVTDPPYGVEYDPGWREKAGVAALGSAKGKVLNDDKADWREAWALFPGDVAYVWHAGLFAGVVGDSLNACGFQLRSQIIWDKGQLVLSRGDYHWEHEPCWYAVKKGATGHWAGDRKQTTVWHIAKPKKNETGHGTQKPVECMKRPIENNSRRGDAIYEPFSGSFTTGIACEMTERRCFAIELNPAYVDMAVERWETFTGKIAILDGDGRTFSEVKSERSGEGAV